MTREILNEIVKAKKINLDNYDKVCAWVNPQYTFVYVTFGIHECVQGNQAKMQCTTSFKLSVSSILKKETHFPEEYETDPRGEFIWNLK